MFGTKIRAKNMRFGEKIRIIATDIICYFSFIYIYFPYLYIFFIYIINISYALCVFRLVIDFNIPKLSQLNVEKKFIRLVLNEIIKFALFAT